jgi:UrcA family protein
MAFKSTMLLCLTAAASATVCAEADSIFEMHHSTSLRVENVNFDRRDDVAALYERITYAADQVCGPRTTTGSYYTSPGYTRCYSQAVDETVARVNRPELTAYYQEQLAHNPRRVASK